MFRGFTCDGADGTLCYNVFTPSGTLDWVYTTLNQGTLPVNWIGHHLTIDTVAYDISASNDTTVTIVDPPAKHYQLQLTTTGSGTVCNDVLTPDPAPTDWVAGNLVNRQIKLDGVAYAVSSNTTTTATFSYGPRVPWSIDVTVQGTGGTLVSSVFTPSVAPVGWTGNLAGLSLLMLYTGLTFPIASNTTTSVTLGSPTGNDLYWGFKFYTSGSAAGLVDGVLRPLPFYGQAWTPGMFVGTTVSLGGTNYTITDNDASSLTVDSSPADGIYNWSINYTASGYHATADGNGTLIPSSPPTGWVPHTLAGQRTYVGYSKDYTIIDNTATTLTVDLAEYGWSISSLYPTSGSTGKLCDKTLTAANQSTSWTAGMLNGVTAHIGGVTYTVASNTTTSFTVDATDPIHGPYTWDLGLLKTAGDGDVCGNYLMTRDATAALNWPTLVGNHIDVDGTTYQITTVTQMANPVNGVNPCYRLTLDGTPDNTFDWSIDSDWEVLGSWTAYKYVNYQGGYSCEWAYGSGSAINVDQLDFYQYRIGSASPYWSVSKPVPYIGSPLVLAYGIAGSATSDPVWITVGTGHGFAVGDKADLLWVNNSTNLGCTVDIIDTTDTTIKVDYGSYSYRPPSGFAVGVSRHGQTATLYFGPAGSYSVSGKAITSVCVFKEAGQYAIEVDGLPRAVVSAATWESAPHRIGFGSTGPLYATPINVTETRGTGDTAPVNCTTCPHNCGVCLDDDPPDCFEVWLTGVAESSPPSGLQCGCVNNHHVFIPFTPAGMIYRGGSGVDPLRRIACSGSWGSCSDTGNYGNVSGFTVEFTNPNTSKYWNIAIVGAGDTSPFGNDNSLLLTSTRQGWATNALTDHKAVIGGTQYAIVSNTSTSITVDTSATAWSLNLGIAGTNAQLQDGVLKPGYYPQGWATNNLVGIELRVDGNPYTITANTSTSATAGINPSNLSWSLTPSFTRSGSYATLQNGVLRPSSPSGWTNDRFKGLTVDITSDYGGTTTTANITGSNSSSLTTDFNPRLQYAIATSSSYYQTFTTSGYWAALVGGVLTPGYAPNGWTAGQLVGHHVTLGSTAYLITANTATSLTLDSPPADGFFSAWSLDLGFVTGYGYLVNGVFTPETTPTNWLGGEFVGCTLYCNDGSVSSSPKFTISANSGSALTISNDQPRGSYHWTLNLGATSGTGTFLNKVLTPNGTPGWCASEWVSYCSLVIDGTSFTIASNDATTITTTATTPHGSHSWALNIIAGGTGLDWNGHEFRPRAENLGWVAGTLASVYVSMFGAQYAISTISPTSFTINSGYTLTWALSPTITVAGSAKVSGNRLVMSDGTWLGNELAGLTVAVHTSANNPTAGSQSDPSVNYTITDNTTSTITVSGSPGDTDNNWYMLGTATGPGATFRGLVGPGRVNCKQISNLQLLPTNSPTPCSWSGAVMHVSAAHGHEVSVERGGICTTCPECRQPKRSYTLTFSGYAGGALASFFNQSYTVTVAYPTHYIYVGSDGTITPQYGTRTCPYVVGEKLNLTWSGGSRSGVESLGGLKLDPNSGNGDALPGPSTLISMTAEYDQPTSPCSFSYSGDKGAASLSIGWSNGAIMMTASQSPATPGYDCCAGILCFLSDTIVVTDLGDCSGGAVTRTGSPNIHGCPIGHPYSPEYVDGSHAHVTITAN